MYRITSTSFHLDRFLSKISLYNGMEFGAASVSEYWFGKSALLGWFKVPKLNLIPGLLSIYLSDSEQKYRFDLYAVYGFHCKPNYIMLTNAEFPAYRRGNYPREDIEDSKAKRIIL